MDDVVEVLIPVKQAVARRLADPREREAMGQLINDAVRARFAAEFAQALKDCQESARAAGLTEEEIDAELEAYNAERRSHDDAD